MVNIIDRQEYEDISEVNIIAGLKHFPFFYGTPNPSDRRMVWHPG